MDRCKRDDPAKRAVMPAGLGWGWERLAPGREELRRRGNGDGKVFVKDKRCSSACFTLFFLCSKVGDTLVA